MPCRQLIRHGHPPDPTSGDIGLSPFSRSPSPFALFSNRLTKRGSHENAGNEPRKQGRIKKLVPQSEETCRQLTLDIIPPQRNVNLYPRRGALLPMSLPNLMGGQHSSWLLMVAPKSLNEPQSSTSWKDGYPSYAAGSADFLSLPQHEEYRHETISSPPTKNDGPIQENKKPDPTASDLDIELLPIKKRRLRQILQEQELLNNPKISPEPEQEPYPGLNVNQNSGTSSTLTSQSDQNSEQLSNTLRSTSVPNTNLALPSTSTQSGTLFLNAATTTFNPRQAPLPVKVKRRPVYIGDRKSRTFIDIESQRWWDRAHLAYPFHPKEPEERRQKKPLLPDIYDEDDPRSQHFEGWLTSFYSESSSDLPKNNLLEKLGLVNPLQGEDHKMPPWVTPEGLKDFDLSQLHSLPRFKSSQKFTYD